MRNTKEIAREIKLLKEKIDTDFEKKIAETATASRHFHAEQIER
jgi:hypothetical protein